MATGAAVAVSAFAGASVTASLATLGFLGAALRLGRAGLSAFASTTASLAGAGVGATIGASDAGAAAGGTFSVVTDPAILAV